MGCRILLAEDDDDLRKTLAGILRHEGFRASACKGGLQALAFLRDQLPDLMLLDLNIRDMNGDDFLRRQSSDPLIRSVPVVVLAGRQAPRLARPVAGTLQKPFGVQDLLRAVIDGCA
jgi:CheY-like chemotaxis protein